MTNLILKLEEWSSKDNKVRAVLRHSLSFEPGTHPPAYPYIEWLFQGDGNIWHREIYYLVAGLWAAHWREGRTGESMSLGKACAVLRNSPNGSASIEHRFITLLDSDLDQLTHHLRQMVALLKDYNLDFENVLRGLLDWGNDKKRTQNLWARDFYRNLNQAKETDSTRYEEENK
jgi:CRISPR system Cascade subunit CasB